MKMKTDKKFEIKCTLIKMKYEKRKRKQFEL